MTFALTPKTLIGISVSMLVLAAVFGVLNNLKVKGLHADVANFTATHEAAEHRRIADEKNLKAREAAAAEATRKFAESESKAAKAEANLGQAQLDEARRSLDSAETEKVFLSDKLRVAQERVTQLEDEKKRRAAVAGKPGVRGTVLAVNQAYNFVVLNLGGRQGVEPNSEMLVLRDGVLIGKIRISSVEPATAIGDIIGSSLARGVQVQPGDIVIYAGTNS